MRAGGDLLECDFDRLRKAAQAAEAQLVVREFLGGGELAVEQEIGDLFELAVGGELENVVAAIVEVVAVAAYGAERGVASGNAGERYGFLRLEGVGYGCFNRHVRPREARAKARFFRGSFSGLKSAANPKNLP